MSKKRAVDGKMEQHPLGKILPPCDEQTLRHMAESIAREGLHDAITTYGGRILDGWGRYLACAIAGVTPRFEEYTGDNPFQYFLSKNLHRRHLNESQRSMSAYNVWEMSKSGDIPNMTQNYVADQFNVSPRMIDDASLVNKAASEKLQQSVRDGVVRLTPVAKAIKMAVKKTGIKVGKTSSVENRKTLRDAVDCIMQGGTVPRVLRQRNGWTCEEIEEKDLPSGFITPRITSVVEDTNIKKVVIGRATLYCCDCRDLFADLEFDSIVTDPPYGLGKFSSWQQRQKTKKSDGTWATDEDYMGVTWDNETPDVLFLLERNVPTMIFGGNYFAGLPPSRKWLIWDKGKDRLSFAEAELCWCSFDGTMRIIRPIRADNIDYEKRIKGVHPTRKPIAVMRRCIAELPKGSGNIICDPYMGSGTTGVAAVNLGRAFIGIEQNEKYFEIACQRIELAKKHNFFF